VNTKEGISLYITSVTQALSACVYTFFKYAWYYISRW